MDVVKMKETINLHQDFFKRDDVKLVGALPGGDTFIRVYLELLTKAVQSGGYLRSSNVLGTITDELAAVCGVDEKTISRTVDLFSKRIETDGETYIYFDDADLRFGDRVLK